MNERFTIVTLHELLAVTRDGQTGFSLCAEHAQDELLKRGLMTRASRRASAAAELRELIERLGGNPEVQVRTLGTNRGWVNLQVVVTQNDDEALVAECEHGEDHALEVYRNALDEHLPDFVQEVVLRHFEDMVSDHDQIRILRGEPPLATIAGSSTGGDARQ